MQITNLLGQTMIEKSLSGELSTVSLENLSAGVYLIQIKTEKGVFVQKIVVQ
jgi:hypothetical protein